MANTGSLPAENMLLAAATPERRHGVAFGIKFVLAFGAAPVAIRLVAYINDVTGEFTSLFLILAAVGLGVVVASALLPKLQRPGAVAPGPPDSNVLAERAPTL